MKEKGVLFDPSWRASGDAEWMNRLLQQGTPMAVLKQFTSVFAFTGTNLSESRNANRERQELAARAPSWARWSKPAIVLQHRLRRWMSGMYSQSPFSYEVFTMVEPERRRIVKVEKPRVGWPS